jgi:hypothetical protein
MSEGDANTREYGTKRISQNRSLSISRTQHNIGTYTKKLMKYTNDVGTKTTLRKKYSPITPNADLIRMFYSPINELPPMLKRQTTQQDND